MSSEKIYVVSSPGGSLKFTENMLLGNPYFEGTVLDHHFFPKTQLGSLNNNCEIALTFDIAVVKRIVPFLRDGSLYTLFSYDKVEDLLYKNEFMQLLNYLAGENKYWLEAVKKLECEILSSKISKEKNSSIFENEIQDYISEEKKNKIIIAAINMNDKKIHDKLIKTNDTYKCFNIIKNNDFKIKI